MELVKINKINIPTIPDNSEPYAARPIPEFMPPLMHLCGVIGGTGSGKTTSILRFLLWADRAGVYDRLIVFSPTLSREAKGKAFMASNHKFELTYYEEYTDNRLCLERERMLADIRDWNDFLFDKKAYAKYRSGGELTLPELWRLEELDFQKPLWKFKHEYYPTCAILLDDHVGRRGVFDANCKSQLVQVCVEHRHLGLSIYLLSQVFKNFIPKQLRGGIINLWFLFGTKSTKHMQEIAESVASKIDPKQFIAAWQLATKDSPHDFLMCDYKENDPNRMLRKNFNQYIQPTGGSLEQEEEEEVPPS